MKFDHLLIYLHLKEWWLLGLLFATLKVKDSFSLLEPLNQNERDTKLAG